MAEIDVDVRAYAAVVAALSDATRSRAEILGAHGLDEQAWAEIDERWQQRLSRSMDDEAEGVPALIAAYAAAFACSKKSIGTSLSWKRFAEATREIRRRGDPAGALARLGIPLDVYLEASGRWTQRMIEDPDLAEEFRRVVGGS